MSEHTIVLRVEHASETGPDGLPLGPYARDYTGTSQDVHDVVVHLRRAHPDCDDPHHPDWGSETWTFRGQERPIFFIENRYALRAAFASGKQLADWFTAEQRELLELAGYVVRKYLVPATDVAVGRRQVAFFADHAQDAGALAPTGL